MLADHGRHVAARRGEMRCIRTEVDRCLLEDGANFVGAFDDGSQVRMVMGAQSVAACNTDDLLEGGAKPLDVVRLRSAETLGAAADNQMFGAKFGCGPRRPVDAGEFLIEDVIEDEVAAGIGGEKLEARGIQDLGEVIQPVLIVEEIAVEDSMPV